MQLRFSYRLLGRFAAVFLTLVFETSHYYEYGILSISRKILKAVSSGAVTASLLAFASIGFSPVAVANPQCSSAIIDADGDGWGFENGQSCTIPTGHPACSAAATVGSDGWGFENGRSCVLSGGRPICTSNAVDNGGGWGYENNQSCRFAPSFSGNASTSSSSGNSSSIAPVCSSAAVNNGDGWGWENNGSCRFNGSPSTTSQSTSSAHPSCGSAAVNNGDGFGWENGATCQFRADSIITSNVEGTFIDGVRQCSPTAEDNGNGFGFEFGESCVWGDVQPLANRNSIVAAPPPVTVGAIGYVDGSPICLTDASDGNADGFGYENNRSCRVVAGTTATSADPLLNTRWCQPWAEISYDDYVLQNNTWNSGDVYSNRWSQCIELTGNRGNYTAEWDYNWLERDEGNDFSVKSYPQVFYGRKTANSISGPVEKLGLPAKVYELPDYKVRYRYSETGVAERNVALESFFHTSCEAEEFNKQFEMMIWVNKPVIKTPGLKVTEATIDGKVWDVFTNPALTWGYVAFVEQTPSTEGWLDWNKFVEWTRFQGPRYGVWQVGNNTCMGAIEIGTETFWGNGTFKLHEFRVTR